MSEKIHQIEGYVTSIYLVEKDGDLLLLDGCCRPDVETVKNYIEEILQKPFSDLKLVISTHVHPDHGGGLTYFKKLGIPIAGPEHFNQWYRGVSGFLTFLVDIMLTYLVAFSKGKGFKNLWHPRKLELDTVLREGMRVPGFEDWEVLHCPGHTLMDLTLYNPQRKLAYVADNFVGFKENIFRPYPLHSPELYKKSLKRYLDLGIEEFLMAHYGRTRISKDRIEKLMATTPNKPRKHTNTLPAITMKLFRAFLRKRR